MTRQHISVPAVHYAEIQAVHPSEDLVALRDASGRDWIWYKGRAVYVRAEYLPAAQWVVDYAYKDMYFGGCRAVNDLETLLRSHVNVPHFANCKEPQC